MKTWIESAAPAVFIISCYFRRTVRFKQHSIHFSKNSFFSLWGHKLEQYSHKEIKTVFLILKTYLYMPHVSTQFTEAAQHFLDCKAVTFLWACCQDHPFELVSATVRSYTIHQLFPCNSLLGTTNKNAQKKKRCNCVSSWTVKWSELFLFSDFSLRFLYYGIIFLKAFHQNTQLQNHSWHKSALLYLLTPVEFCLFVQLITCSQS